MNQQNKPPKKSHYKLCLKEFRFAAITTMAYILISCIISYVMGYAKSPAEIRIIAGIPDWALFGVVIPWVLMVALTVVYGFFVMEGDEEE